MVPFRYKEFYDVPRVIVLRYEGKLVLLYCAFDDRLDEYPDNYVLPEALEPSLENESWLFLEDAKQVLLGQIPVKAVKFDPTRRAQLDPSVLDEVLCEA